MNASLAGQKQRWAIAAGAAGVVLATLLLLFRAPPPPTLLPPPSAPSGTAGVKHAVQLAAPADQLLRDETELRDLRPLFLPTDRNAKPADLKREPGRTFLDSDTVKLSFPETELHLPKAFPPVAMVADAPADKATALDALASESAFLTWFGIGRGPVAIQSLKPRGGYVEVISWATGKRLWGEVLPVAEARPPGDKPWAPVEFLARIDAAGLATPLDVTTSSGVEEVDAHFRKFLAKSYRLGERLEPGFYRVIVAP